MKKYSTLVVRENGTHQVLKKSKFLNSSRRRQQVKNETEARRKICQNINMDKVYMRVEE